MGIWNWVTDIYHDVTGIPTAKEKRDRQDMVNEQIRSYREQTELTRQELARKRDETNVQKRRVEEKQIRTLRRNSRSQGLLGASQSNENDMSTKLGG